MQNKPSRRKSRAIAMELLYSETVNTRNEEITDDFIEEFSDISETTEVLDRDYIRTITRLAKEKDSWIKDLIRPYLKEWTIERLSRVNLAILKIAVLELFFMDGIPERVSLNEALELSKTYSDEESTAFINGILDRILKAKPEIQQKMNEQEASVESQPETTDAEPIPGENQLVEEVSSATQVVVEERSESPEEAVEMSSEEPVEMSPEEPVEMSPEETVEMNPEAFSETISEEGSEMVSEAVAEADSETSSEA